MAQRMVFEWVEGSHITLDAAVVGNYLQDVKERVGSLTPDAVVDDATRRDSPLHPYF